jgi:hypothetical protein
MRRLLLAAQLRQVGRRWRLEKIRIDAAVGD